jgi:hypothetical protein
MLKEHIAELLLSLFISRERAASTVGDLIENTEERGAWSFWSGISRTVLSLFWGSFASEPYVIAGIGFRGLLLNFSLHLASVICFAIFGALFGMIVAGFFASPTA